MASSTNRIVSYVKDPQNYNLYWENRTLFTTLDNACVRAIFTTVFLVLNFLIVVVATFFLNKRNLYRLRRKLQSVPVNCLTSWMSLAESIKYGWDTLQLPGGSCGILTMYASGLFSLAHQYVNLCILPAYVQSTCTFNYGVVTTLNYNLVPASTWSSASTVYNAQYQVWLHGGEWGIYDKVNYTSAGFRPTPHDVIGGWNCSHYDTTIEWSDWQDLSLVESFLRSQNFPYPGFNISADYNPHENSLKGFLAWSAEQPDDSTAWHVRASVSTNLNGSAATVTNLECLLVAKGSRTLPDVPMSQSLHFWTDKTFGLLMNETPTFYKWGIELMLNAMVMVSGSGNYDKWPPPEDTDTYGCVVQGTKIFFPLWTVLGVTLLAFVLLVFADIRLFFRSANDVEDAPSSVQTWQLALLRELAGNNKIKMKQMRDYSFKWDSLMKKYVLA